jgi:hypothetical protein
VRSPPAGERQVVLVVGVRVVVVVGWTSMMVKPPATWTPPLKAGS